MINLKDIYSQDKEGFFIIEISVENIEQLFHSLDSSVLYKKDLDPAVENYILEAVEELENEKKRVVVYCKNKPFEAESCDRAKFGIGKFFNYKREFHLSILKNKIKQGAFSSFIGLAFLLSYSFYSKYFGDGVLHGAIEEGLLIIGWVALWKPIEIFLYDWRNEYREFKLYKEALKLDISFKIANL